MPIFAQARTRAPAPANDHPVARSAFAGGAWTIMTVLGLIMSAAVVWMDRSVGFRSLTDVLWPEAVMIGWWWAFGAFRLSHLLRRTSLRSDRADSPIHSPKYALAQVLIMSEVAALASLTDGVMARLFMVIGVIAFVSVFGAAVMTVRAFSVRSVAVSGQDVLPQSAPSAA